MTAESNLTPGIYRHYKGNMYFVMNTARHSEAEESLVHYRCLYGRFDSWVRPLQNFLSTVDVNGEPVPRFAYERAANTEELARYLSIAIDANARLQPLTTTD